MHACIFDIHMFHLICNCNLFIRYYKIFDIFYKISDNLLTPLVFNKMTMSMSNATQAHRENLQRQTQADWVNREYIDLIAGSIKRIADFLNSFDMSCRY